MYLRSMQDQLAATFTVFFWGGVGGGGCSWSIPHQPTAATFTGFRVGWGVGGLLVLRLYTR